jgi:hypothetical protein
MREGCHFLKLLDIGMVEDEILIRIYHKSYPRLGDEFMTCGQRV